MLRRRLLSAAAAVAVSATMLAGCSTPADVQPTASEAPTIPAGAYAPVIALLTQRLDVSEQVAASKWFSGQAVADPAREQAVLDAADQQAVATGADREYIANVFADQITASKILQQALLDSWHAGDQTPPASAPDLATQIRPALDSITQQLVPALASVQPYASSPGCVDAVFAAVDSAAKPIGPGGSDAFNAAIASLCS